MGRLLEVNNLCTSFYTKFGEVKAVNNVSFTLDEGEVLAIVGESGSGKSVTSMSIMQLVAKGGKIKSGEILFEGKDIVKMPEKELKTLRGKEISMIFQDPMTCLNPVFTIGSQMEEVLKLHFKDMSSSDRKKKCLEMLEKVGLSNPEERLKQYPHELSGGMRQRVMIAMSLLCNPKLLIADEPTTALDVTIQAQIIDLMKQLRKEFKTAIILITHDLGVVASIADKVNVMYAGEVVESAKADDLYYSPKHPYTWGLLKALPKLDMKEDELQAIPGSTPDLLLEMKGCPFFDRCDYGMECCRDFKPGVYEAAPGQHVRCFRYHPDFPQGGSHE
ncbi:MAG: ABC transporter ATP-binding protein [Erysipelotrichaceae bacterium]|nr:ABC transporter ATP-binding protein [Erysipelotrichaceae bacterium]